MIWIVKGKGQTDSYGLFNDDDSAAAWMKENIPTESQDLYSITVLIDVSGKELLVDTSNLPPLSVIDKLRGVNPKIKVNWTGTPKGDIVWVGTCKSCSSTGTIQRKDLREVSSDCVEIFEKCPVCLEYGKNGMCFSQKVMKPLD